MFFFSPLNEYTSSRERRLTSKNVVSFPVFPKPSENKIEDSYLKRQVIYPYYQDNAVRFSIEKYRIVVVDV